MIIAVTFLALLLLAVAVAFSTVHRLYAVVDGRKPIFLGVTFDRPEYFILAAEKCECEMVTEGTEVTFMITTKDSNQWGVGIRTNDSPKTKSIIVNRFSLWN